MRIKTKVTRVNNNYKGVERKYLKHLRDKINISCNLVRNTIIDGISAGGKGRMYGDHQASAPFDYPATDTGYLISNIGVFLDTDGLGGNIESRAEYSENLEFGTSRVLPRPFMQPSLEENRNRIKNLFREIR